MFLLRVKFIDSVKERINIVPAGHRRDIAAGRNHKVRILAALLHDGQRCFTNRFRCAVAELTGRINVAHTDDIGRNLGHDFLHVNRIAEVIGVGIGTQNRIQRDICRVTAVMIDDSEVFVLDFFYNALAVIAGEFNSQRRRQQTCERLCDNHAVCADCLVCLDVLDDNSVDFSSTTCAISGSS